MPATGQKEFKCILCSKRTKVGDRKRCQSKEIRRFLSKKFFINVCADDILCNKCRHHYYNQKTSLTRNAIEIVDEARNKCETPSTTKKNLMSSPPSVSLRIPSTSKSHAYCFICKKPGPKLVVVSASIRFSVFMSHEIIIPAGNRCCPNHIQDGILIPESLKNISTTDCALVNRTTILDLLKKVREFTLKNQNSRIDFSDSSTLKDTDYVNLTGINKNAFNDLHLFVKDTVRNTPSRSTRMSLGIFLMKLKSGMSNKILSTVFAITISSLRRAISSIRHALVETFVPQHLGLQHISRNEVIENHTRPLAESLLGNGTRSQAIVVLDGTYIYIQKSNNFQFQRRSYSVHKGRPLVKPMMIVCTDGYFLSVVGPYLADYKNNDASILTHMLKTNVEDIKNWIHEEDVFVVDRGFRDSIELLEELGINAEMPHFMNKGEKQMSTSDANLSRLVTKVRWVVESANARVKRWKYLDHILPTNQVPFIGDYVRIVCAISNRFDPPLSSGNEADDTILASKMLYLSKQINYLKLYVEENNLERRSAIWKTTDGTLPNFPRLDEDQLRDLTCGTYQLKLSESYAREHLDGDCDIKIHEEDDQLIRVRIQSRHVSSRTYLLWIKYTPSNISAWYCKCRAGARVVGVCSHIASIVWYLGFARHEDKNSFGVKNWAMYLSDAAVITKVIDGSDSDESGVEE